MADSEDRNKRGLPLHLQKQILIDIETSGGFGPNGKLIGKFSALCKKRPEIYGKPQSKE